VTERLCEVQDSMREAVMEIGLHARPPEGAKLVRQWASLRCPHRGGCNKSAPRCDGMTPENRQIISKLKDKLFMAGVVPEDQLFSERK